MEQQFIVGDIVTIADLSTLRNLHYGVNDGMAKMSGKPATIIRVHINKYTPQRIDEDGCLYVIDIDNGSWSWSNRMFIAGTSSGPFKVSDDDFE